MRRVALALALLLAGAAPADEYDAGAFVVYYTALSTTELTPAIAEAYGVARDASRGLLDVSVRRKVGGRLAEPVTAIVVVSAVNLEGQLKPMQMRRVGEPPAIDYLGEFTVADQETVTFDLLVTPVGVREPYRLRLRQQFFAR